MAVRGRVWGVGEGRTGRAQLPEEHRISARVESTQSSGRGCPACNGKGLPGASWDQMALLTLKLFASVCIVTLLFFHLVSIYSMPATESVAKEKPDVLQGLVWGA